jgi:hypothetical protein
MRPAIMLVLLVGLVGPAIGATPAENAHALCLVMERSGATTECTVNAWGSTVDARVDTNSREARKMCVGMSDVLAQRKIGFDGRWKLRIFSPYSGDHPLAVCTLK